jgi:hypothetical protein
VRGGDGATTRQIVRGSRRCQLVTRLMRGGHVRGFASQLLSSIEARGGDRGIWLKLPRISLARSSQLRRGYQESLAGRDRILDKRTEYV